MGEWRGPYRTVAVLTRNPQLPCGRLPGFDCDMLASMDNFGFTVSDRCPVSDKSAWTDAEAEPHITYFTI
jgi:hypothetical protein